MNPMITITTVLLTLLLLLLVAMTTEAAVTLTFNVATATELEYSQLLTDIRNEVRDPRLNYGGTGLPVIGAPTKPPVYFYVDLVYGIKTIKIALNKDDLYVVGYLDSIDGHYRAQFFKDAPPNVEAQVFEIPAKYITRLHYTGSYPDIAGHTKVKRDVDLGIEPLRTQIDVVYGKPVVLKKQGTLLLMVIHMISEAARFRYIEGKIKENFDTEYHPFYKVDPKAASLENEWGKISTAINKSVNGVINPALDDLEDVHGHPWTVTRVRDIVNDMALLKYVPNGRQLSLYSTGDDGADSIFI